MARELPPWITANVPDDLIESRLFRFEVMLQVADATNPQQRKKIVVDILPDLIIDMEIIEEQMRDIPTMYAFWSAVYSEVRLSVAVAERNLKVRRGKATKEIQDEARREGTRLPADQVKLIVESDDLLVKADLNLAKAHMLAGKLYHMLEAIRMKHEDCRSLIGLKKHESNNS